jgi:hypothetical protein
MGGAPVLDGRHLKGRRNNQPNDGVGGRGGVGEAMRSGGTRGRGRLIVLLGDEWSDEKNKNREGDGASDFDGFYWIGGRNNQLTSDRIGGIYLGETACRAITVWEDAVESFQPSVFGQKINITKFVVA